MYLITVPIFFADILEGNLTDAMEKKYTDACQEVFQEIQHAMTKNGENRATALLTYPSQSLLCDKACIKLTNKGFNVMIFYM